MLGAVFLIMVFGVILIMAGSPAVANRLGLPSSYFITRQLIFIAMGVGVIFIISLLPVKLLRYFALGGFIFAFTAMILVLFYGEEIKGSTRWLSIAGFSFQPSEFMKPFLIMVVGWILAEKHFNKGFPGFAVAATVFATVIILLVLQPDIGMSLTVAFVFAAQMFLAGIPLFWVGAAIISAATSIVGAYFFLPHVTKRIDRFLDPASGDNYQVDKSLQAFANGGLYGRGPGEGRIKELIPDSHTDFIFSVAGEELGLVACLLIVALFAFVVVHGFIKIMNQSDLFVLFSCSGLLIQFGIQAIINMGVALNLMPTKGMTLPFISYGGSSSLAMAIGIGMVLALTRKRYGNNTLRAL